MPEYKSPQSEPGTEQRFVLVFLLMAAVIFGAQLYMKKYSPASQSSAHPNQAVKPTAPTPAPQPPAPVQSAVAPSRTSIRELLRLPRLARSRRSLNLRR